MDVLLTPSLVRAARGLIDWQQKELAERAGLSLSAVKNFESGKKTHDRTEQSIRAALVESGVEFPLSGGVRKKEDVTTVRRIVGPDFIQKMNEDIYATLRKPRDEILGLSAGEHLWPQEASKKYQEWRERLQINAKNLIAQGQSYVNMPRQNYRTLPPELIGKITYSLYADRLAIILWKKKQGIIIRNQILAEAFRAQFFYLWRQATPLK